jgi:molybdopterin-guanine dinucleotide biosynthesis protein A
VRDVAGVVLAGGQSSRMGTSKAALEWHGSTLLYRTAALLGRTVGGPVVVVRAAGQELPALPDGVVVVADPVPGLGPLQGIAAGLAAVAAAPVAFVCSTDMPFLHPAFVARVVDAIAGPDAADVALPFARGYRQPLAAAYRTALADPITALLAVGKRQPGMLFAQCRVTVLDDAALLADPTLAALDPGLESVTNVNEPCDYAAARARAPEPVAVEWAGTLSVVRAATLGAAAQGVGVALGGDVAVVLNGHAVAPDPQLPLVAGDVVAFR